MPHFMIRWQFTDISAKALVGKPNDRTGAAEGTRRGLRRQVAQLLYRFRGVRWGRDLRIPG